MTGAGSDAPFQRRAKSSLPSPWRRPRLAPPLLLAALMLCSCQNSPSNQKAGTAARGPGVVSTGDRIVDLADAADAVKVDLGGVVKNAVAIEVGRPVRVNAAAGAWLYFAAGLVPGATTGEASFRVKSGDETILELRLDPRGRDGWREASVRLPDPLAAVSIECDLAGPGAYLAHPRVLGPAELDRPPLYFILIDALRADALGAHGDASGASPRLDRLAAEGAIFKRAYTSSTFTITSLASIETGLHPWTHQVLFAKNAGLILSPETPNLVNELRRAGYHTAAFSGTYFRLSKNGFDRGFDHVDETCAESFFKDSADCLNRRVFAWLEADVVRGPTFVFIHYVDPHAPYFAPEDFRLRYVQGLKPPSHPDVAAGEVRQYGPDRAWTDWGKKPSPDDVAYLRALYQGEVAYIDAAVGELLDKLQARAGARPYIVVTADHGEAFYEHGVMEHARELHDPVMRVPLIVWGTEARGKSIEDPVRSIDLLPTLLDLIGAPTLPHLAGRSLVPLLRGQPFPPAPAVALRFIGNDPEYALVVWPWKLFAFPRKNQYRLYNLELDPAEAKDLAGARPETLGLMRGVLSGLLEPSSSRAGAPAMDPETVRRLRDLGY